MRRKAKYIFDLDYVRKRYKGLIPEYNRLAINLKQAIEQFLSKNSIKYLVVDFRIKDTENLIEKAIRKKYSNPLTQCEDLCGLRVICYYKSDISIICKIIETEFDIIESQDQEELLEKDKFGYRSNHYIVRIKEEWLKAPNYRGLEELKAEIQVRTILMHAWAEIQHELAYKSKIQVPDEFQRNLFRISASLEGADKEFDELKTKMYNYRIQLIEKAHKEGGLKDIPLNLDNLQALFDYYFADKDKDIVKTRYFLDDMATNKISFNELADYLKRTKGHLKEIEKQYIEAWGKKEYKFSQADFISLIFEIFTDIYKDRFWVLPEYEEFIDHWKTLFKK